MVGEPVAYVQVLRTKGHRDRLRSVFQLPDQSGQGGMLAGAYRRRLPLGEHDEFLRGTFAGHCGRAGSVGSWQGRREQVGRQQVCCRHVVHHRAVSLCDDGRRPVPVVAGRSLLRPRPLPRLAGVRPRLLFAEAAAATDRPSDVAAMERHLRRGRRAGAVRRGTGGDVSRGGAPLALGLLVRTALTIVGGSRAVRPPLPLRSGQRRGGDLKGQRRVRGVP